MFCGGGYVKVGYCGDWLLAIRNVHFHVCCVLPLAPNFVVSVWSLIAVLLYGLCEFSRRHIDFQHSVRPNHVCSCVACKFRIKTHWLFCVRHGLRFIKIVFVLLYGLIYVCWMALKFANVVLTHMLYRLRSLLNYWIVLGYESVVSPGWPLLFDDVRWKLRVPNFCLGLGIQTWYCFLLFRRLWNRKCWFACACGRRWIKSCALSLCSWLFVDSWMRV